MTGTPKPIFHDQPRAARPRLDSVDLLRGLVMTLMVLDHTRGFFTSAHYDPLDLTQTSAPLFLTRWITAICAPVFFSLAGAGAFLWQARGKSTGGLSSFLLTRGLWLVFLDVTFTCWFGWKFNFSASQFNSVVLWALGWCMVALAALVWLPVWAVTAIGLAMIALHNTLDGITPENWGPWSGLWKVLHTGGNVDLGRGMALDVIYPLVPWIGVMAVGYGFGTILLRDAVQRRRWMISCGLILVVLFVAVRWSNVYGDPVPWSSQKNGLFTLFSFIKCHKYPPSLCFLLMAAGPALLLLALFDKKIPALLRPLLVFGRAPLFFYLLHLPLIHSLAVAVNLIRFGRADWLYGPQPRSIPAPPDAGFGLAGVYFISAVILLVLYPACQWFAGLKSRSRAAWLSYL